MRANLIKYRGVLEVFNCKKCVCVNSSNLFSNKLFPKLNFLSLLDLVLTNSIFLSLFVCLFVCFCLAVKNVKAKVKKIQILSNRAVQSVAVMLLIHHIWLHGLMVKISGDIELILELNKSRIKLF